MRGDPFPYVLLYKASKPEISIKSSLFSAKAIVSEKRLLRIVIEIWEEAMVKNEE